MRLVSLIVILYVLQPQFLSAQNKMALIVAVGQYPQVAKVKPIAPVNDIKYIKSALRKNGFLDKNIDTLVNAKATKAAILNGLANLAKKAKRNDIIVISFGCHGQQIRDQRTVELGKDEDDGYDEALLPYDARGSYSPTAYRGEKHLRDDELQPLLTEIRKQIGPDGSLLVLIDACHSGTGTRADDFPASRGEPVPFPDPENPYDPSDISDFNDKGSFFEEYSDSVSNMVVISGSGPHQENKQMVVHGEELGSLSYAFYKAISEMPAGNDYGVLFQKIKATIQAIIPDQVPMMEGNTNQVVFSGKYLPKEERNYIRVGLKEAVRTGTDTVFFFNKGLMDNVSPGQTGKLYPAGKEEEYAKIVIRKSAHFTSIGVSDKMLSRGESYEIRLDEEDHGNLRAAVKFSKESAPAPLLEKQVKQFLSPYQFIQFAHNADFQFEMAPAAEGKKAQLRDRNNKLVWSASMNGDTLLQEDKKQLVAGIKNALRVSYLRTLPDGGDLALLITAKIIPESGETQPEGVVLKEGDKYSLKITNNSDLKLFYTVLDIYPDNQVKVLYPSASRGPADYSIEKNSFVERKLAVSKSTPMGVEFLKIIVSKEPMDLRPVFEHSAQRFEMRSFQAMLDDLFNDIDRETSTRADVSGIKAEEVGIVTVQFTIQKNGP